MANEIQWRHSATGATLYCTFRHRNGTMWNTDTDDLESLSVANWADYAYALAETPASGYLYLADWPGSLAEQAAWYWCDIYLRAGETPAITDTLLGTLILHCSAGGVCIGPIGADVQAVAGSTDIASRLYDAFGVEGPKWTVACENQTGDAYAVVAHEDYGNARLVRSTTPANTLSVDEAHKVAVPDTQKVDVNTLKSQTITCSAAVTIQPTVGLAAAKATQLEAAIGTAKVAASVAAGDIAQDAITASAIKADAVQKINAAFPWGNQT